ncbi:MAG: 4-hydroxy-tetrahydrodipicolinate synthase [Actinomycetota bacterium]
MARFGRVVTAMVTPFTEDLSLDVDRAQELAGWLVDHGSDGLVVTGSTGESATLTDQEKVTMWRAVSEAVGERATVIAGTGTYDTAHSIHLSEEAEKAGADGLLIVTPYYNKPPQRGLVEHFTRVAQSTGLPNIVYNIPGRTGTRIAHETLLRLGEVDNIVAVKDSTGDFEALARLIAEAPDGFEVYTGDDWATFGSVCLGASGVISVAAHVAGERMGQMIALIEGGDLASARKINSELLPVFDAMFITSNPIPLKKAMELIGQPVGRPRLPLLEANEDETTRIEVALKESGVL